MNKKEAEAELDRINNNLRNGWAVGIGDTYYLMAKIYKMLLEDKINASS